VKHHHSRVLVVASLALLGLGASGCATDSTTNEPTPSTSSTDSTIDPAADSISELELRVSEATMVVDFEAFVDPVSRTMTFRHTGEQLVLPQRSADEATGLRSVRQAEFCLLPVDRNGIAGSGTANSVEIYSETGSTKLDGDCGPQPYYQLGAFCTDVTVRSFFTTQLVDVYAQITAISNRDLFIGFAFPRGTGAPPTPELSNELGLWFYDDLGIADGHMGAPFATPPDERTVQWVFQLLADDNFAFSGRVVGRFAETCNATDDDCDGSVDERAGCYPDGELCTDALDCQTGICSAGRCGVSDFLSDRMINVGGAGTVSDTLNSGEVRVGAPSPMGTTSGGGYQLRLGPLSDR
jgi:hypothetical protein